MINSDDSGLSSFTRKEISSSQSSYDHEKTIYGGLFLLGCNGRLPTGNKGRRCSKFLLYKRDKPNGVKKSNVKFYRTPLQSKSEKDTSGYSIHYSLSREENVTVEYAEDTETDMFQIGRSNEEVIDFIVLGKYTLHGGKAQATVSKFSCRIVANRSDPNDVRIYAAAFDDKKEIILGEKAVQWKKNNGSDVDALTTNGILLNNPDGSVNDNLECGVWREVSVCGSILSVRGPRSSKERGKEIENATNILKDGSLIDLCGATLLWRSAEGLRNGVNKNYLEDLIDNINRNIRKHSLGGDNLGTLKIPRSLRNIADDDLQHPHVYLSCGHLRVGGLKETSPSICSKCHMSGPYQKLCMGMECAFYLDNSSDPVHPKLFSFNPCGHIATEKTVKYWATASLPHGKCGYQAICPFCATELQDCPGYILVKFEDGLS